MKIRAFLFFGFKFFSNSKVLAVEDLLSKPIFVLLSGPHSRASDETIEDHPTVVMWNANLDVVIIRRKTF